MPFLSFCFSLTVVAVTWAALPSAATVPVRPAAAVHPAAAAAGYLPGLRREPGGFAAFPLFLLLTGSSYR